ncbi:MAG: hypothetical protein ACRDOL_43540 [Streptosporangiaceae bacterium]
MDVQPQALSLEDLALAALAGMDGHGSFFTGQTTDNSPFRKGIAGA